MGSQTTDINKGNSEIESRVKSTFELLKNGETEIRLSDKYKDIVLVLGNTGSGKSTFVQWIAGDNDKLISIQDGSEWVVVDDKKRISNSTINSKTIFPELQVDAQTNAAFYDCPGFSDTRNTTIDIAATYFIKKLVDHVRSVKIIFIINHTSVRKGVDRQDFMKLMKHATDFVKNIDKYTNSITIVATKVDNQYVEDGDNFSLVPDEIVVKAIGDFMQEVKGDIQENLKVSTSSKENIFYQNAIKLINVFLVKENGEYTNIGIFRRPNKQGPLSSIPLIQKGKGRINNIVYKKLNFTVKSSDDFGYTISEKSKNEIHDLVEEINRNVWSYGKNITETVNLYYRGLVENVQTEIKSMITRPQNFEFDQLEAQTFTSKFSSGNKTISSLVEQLKDKGIEEMAVKMNSAITGLGIPVPESYVLNIANAGKYFNFLKLVSDKELITRQWEELFKDTLMYFPESQKIIRNDVEEKAIHVNKLLSDSKKTIQTFYDDKMKVLEIQRLPDELNKALSVMRELKQKVEKTIPSSELQKVIESIDLLIGTLGMDLDKPNIVVIVNRQKYLNFLQDVSGINLISDTLPWSCPFEHSVDYLSDSLKWYKYLNGMYSVLSEYKVQENPSRYNVGDLDDWGKDEKLQGIVILKSNFQKFLEKSAEFKVVESDIIKNINVTETQLEELNNVLNIALRQTVQVQCEDSNVFIMGEYIKIQDIIDKKNDNKNCWGSSTDGTYKFINVFALNTIFIERDLPFSRLELSVSFIAPKWEVIGSRDIYLRGTDGGSGNEPDGDSWSNIGSGSDGRDGVPGEPGGPGGSFFGVFEHIKGNSLTITTSGGNGGPGTDGKSGNRGNDGISAVAPPGSTLCSKIKCAGSSNCKFIKSTSSRKPVMTAPDGPPDYIKTETNVLEYFGTQGITGGKGGDGGRGGEGGNAGDVILFELDKSSGISKRDHNGKQGKGGVGGKGGEGGKDGDNLVMTCESTFTPTLWWVDESSTWKTNEKKVGANRGSKGNGSDGANTKGLKSPKSLQAIRPVRIINEYKQFLRKNVNNRLRKYPLNKFLNRLDSNDKVKSVYDTLGLVEELQGLEVQFQNLKSVDLLPFYESLLKRISECAKHPDKFQHSLEHKKVLSYIYTSILGRIQNYKDSSESDLIIDVAKYINSVIDDLNSLKDLKNSKKKYDVIQKYKQQYENNIILKVEEAKNFIDKDILPEIEKAGNEVGKMLEALINEVKDSQKKTKEEQEALNEKRKKLQKFLVLHGVFGLFNVLSQFLGVLGPWGAITGSLISLGSSVGDTTVLLNEDSPDIRMLRLAKGASDLDSIKTQIKDIRDQKITKFQKFLEHMSEEIEKDPEAFGDIGTKVTEIKEKVNKASEMEFSYKDFKNIDNYKKELKDALESKELELKKSEEKPKFRKTMIVLDKLKKTIDLGTTTAETFIRHKAQQAKVDEIDRAIIEAGDKIQKLREYEQNIYTSIAPMLQNVINGVNDISRKLGTKSQVALDITKWKVQSTLKDMQVNMNQLTEGFKSKDNLIRSIEKVNEAMTILIGVYDHIQDFQEQQKLVVYIGDVSSAAADEIYIGDAELRDGVRKLEITIRSSIVLQRYKIAVDAFKQFIFPFAHTYFKNNDLPTHLTLQWKDKDSALDNLVQEAVTKIHFIKSKHTDYKSSVTKSDGYIGKGEFNSNYQALKPFFTWKNEFHKNMIQQLLSGQEVILYANILDSAHDKDAIKFNIIDLQFKARNETMQTKINKVLEKFEVSATHLGNSYYRFNDKIYLITTNSQPIWYYFEKKHGSNQEPVVVGGVYDKIKNGEFMLSPYASWKIKLSNVTKNTLFDSLKIFTEIDLELGGNGHYVNKRKLGNIELNVGKYYHSIEIMDENKSVEEESTSSTKYKREVRPVLENSFHSMHGEQLETQTHVTNSALHISSSINSLFKWFKKRSIALVSSIAPIYIFDKVNTLTENNNCYSFVETSGEEPLIIQEEFSNDVNGDEKRKGFERIVVNGGDFPPERTLDNKDYTLDYIKLHAIESTGRKNEKIYKKPIPNHRTTKYEQDHNFRNAAQLDSGILKNYTSCIRDFESNNPNLLLSAGEKINNSQVLQSLEGWGSLMLADVMMRSITKEKYEQNCLPALSPILEKDIALYHLEQKVRKGLQKMSFLFGDHEVEDVVFSPEGGNWRW